MDSIDIKRRLPHKGDRVRFWELLHNDVRQQATATVVKREKGRLYLWIDGRTGMWTQRAIPMEILTD